MQSIWRAEISTPRFEPLQGDLTTDVLIIGGGLTGLLCAYRLTHAGISCVICEADRICGGVTANTTAKITYQHGAVYHKLLARFGEELAAQYLKSHREALLQYVSLCKNLDCDFEQQDSFVYSRTNRAVIEKEAAALQKIGGGGSVIDTTPLPFSVAGAVKVDKQAQFHPLKFAYALTPKLTIFENTKILELFPGGAVTHHGKIKAKRIIVATHFPFVNKHGSYFLKLYQHRSYVCALKQAPPLSGMYVDEADNGLSFRTHGGYLLLGGGGHRTGKSGGNWNALSAFVTAHYPQAETVFRFATQDCQSLDDMPYMQFVEYYRQYADEDSEESREEVAHDSSSEPDKIFINLERTEAVMMAFENLNYRERAMVSAHLGFCMECYATHYYDKDDLDEDGKPTRKPIPEDAFIDIAIDHGLASPDTADKTYRKALSKIKKELKKKDIL